MSFLHHTLFILYSISYLSHVAAGSSPSQMLWASAPAVDWLSAYPIGNGRLGAMIYGSVDTEIISLNEDSIWSGAFINRVDPNAKAAFPRVRMAMDQGFLTQATQDSLQNMCGTPQSPRNYQPAGDLIIQTNHNEKSQVTAYNRTLDISTGIAHTSYLYKGTLYERYAIASSPSNILAFRLSSPTPASLNLTISLRRDQGLRSVTAGSNIITLRGAGTDDAAFTFTSGIRVVTKAGSTTVSDSSLVVSNADVVDIYWDAETTYRYPDGQTAYETVLNNRLSLAAQQGFDGIKTAASSDFIKLFSRVSLDQGTSGAAGKVETVSRLINLAQNRDIASDPELLTLMYNYGRYLLISSARPNSLPPNLQGVWNNNFNPPWGSKFTIDINLQMNSWLADPMQLSETLSPLWELMKLMQNRGKQVASDMYGLGGWMCHHNTDLWGDCAPADCGSAWTPWPMGAAWILNHASEHYRYTQNATFARQIALPLLSDALSFYYDFAIFKNGYRITWPSLSPENEYRIDSSRSNPGQTTGLDEGSQMDRALLWDLFNGFIELSQATGSTAGVAKAQEFLGQIEGPTISKNTGRLMEWSIDYEETEAAHRHFSPLFGLHPGHQYSPLYNQTIFNAALKLLDHRMDSGSGSTGWSRIWAASLYARSFMGDTALSHINTLMIDYIYSNLFTKTSGVFQIDANFGLVNALNEMYLQSHAGVLHIGPAIPSKGIASGSFRNWLARGAFQVSAQWSGGHITSATILAKTSRLMAVRIENGRSFFVNGQQYTQPFSVTEGMTYRITF